MLVLEALALGGLLMAGGRLPRWRRAQRNKATFEARATPPPKPLPEPERREMELKRAGRDLRLSGLALGLAVAGTAWRMPFLGLASFPVALVVFRPTFGEAWAALRNRRVDTHVLDAVRLSVCAVMGYWIIAGLNALLHAWSQRLLLRSEQTLATALEKSLGASSPDSWIKQAGVELRIPAHEVHPGQVLSLRAGDVVVAGGRVLEGEATLCPASADAEPLAVGPDDRLSAGARLLSGTLALEVDEAPAEFSAVHQHLQSAAAGQTPVRWVGERFGGAMAPWMLGAFALSMPALGINRSASFLTTSFGAQMSRLGPYNARQFIGLAAKAGILIREPRALELATLVNTLILDSQLLADPAQHAAVGGLVHALRQRLWPGASALNLPFAVYVMADDDDQGAALAAGLGLDGYFVGASGGLQAAIVENLQHSGRLACDVASGARGRTAFQPALLSCEVGSLTDAAHSSAHVVLLDPSLKGLMGLFELAPIFLAKQQFNLSAPITADLVDISTTLFLHFGLIYSILFSYSGFLAGIARSRISERVTAESPEPSAAEDTTPTRGLLP